jgi:tRNA/tmRNA/rRNA uracil-C5-methylase (TrmA/RlmC/RlmD family)
LNYRPSNVAEYGGGREKDETPNLTLGELMKMIESGSEPSADDRVGRRASYLIASAANALKSGQALGADVLIVDPPRKGLEDGVLDELCKPFNPKQPSVESPTVLTIPDELVNWANDVQTLIYVSCGFDALARDCDRLLSSRGGWMVESATGYVLFPGSNHVETLCILKRN